MHEVDNRSGFGLRRGLLAGLLPPTCLVCGQAGHRGADLCRACTAALPWNACACPGCGLPLPAPAPACGRCLRRAPPFAAVVAAFAYRFPVDRLLPRLKFHGDLAAGRVLGAGLLAAVRRADRASAASEGVARASGRWREAAERPQALIPVPLHRGRLRERGYNQALELARPLARALGLPLLPAVLRRSRGTAPQTDLSAGARRRNVRGAFAAGDQPLPAHVALIDDVMTTGATVAECARVLRRAGAARVDVWVAARAL